MGKPLCVDLYCGLFGWGAAFVERGYRVVGFDIEDMHAKFGLPRPTEVELVLQDVLTLHGSQFRDAAIIVASPPCQEPSYRAMPWKRAKALNAAGPPVKFIELFNACFRIQREASEAAGRHVPMIVENVRGAQRWVGKAAWHFGSYYLWGDVPALMPFAKRCDKKTDMPPVPVGDIYRATGRGAKTRITEVPFDSGQKFNPDGTNHPMGSWFAVADSKERGSRSGVKVPGLNWKLGSPGYTRKAFNTTVEQRLREESVKVCSHDGGRRTDVGKGARSTSGDCGVEGETPWVMKSSRSPARQIASARIAKIPLPLARHIAEVYYR